MEKLLMIFLVLLLSVQSKAQDISDSWGGALAVSATSLRLVFHIKKTSDTSYSAKFDSPDQNAFGLDCSKIYRVKDSVFIEMALVKGAFKGLWDGKDKMSGIFNQGSFQAALELSRYTGPADNSEPANGRKRPQTPKPPFNYLSDEVEYDNAAKSLHYGATFTHPKGQGKHPAVIIISGSGTQDRDGTLFGHKLYWVLADYLTKNGIAVLRVDDRGAGKSSIGSNEAAPTSLDFSYDVEASLNYLETRSDVDIKHLGLMGHSEGGIIAPMVAARRKDVTYIVLWGAPATGGAKVQTEQQGDAIRSMGVDSLAVDADKSLNLQILGQFASSPTKQILDAKIVTIFDNWRNAQTAKTLNTLWPDGVITAQDLFEGYNGLYDTAWWHFFITYDPSKDLSKVTCSVLAINGAKDVQVRATANLAAIKEILTQSGNTNFEIKELPGLNHLLQTANSGAVAEYEKIDETISPEAMNIISDWIKIHTK